MSKDTKSCIKSDAQNVSPTCQQTLRRNGTPYCPHLYPARLSAKHIAGPSTHLRLALHRKFVFLSHRVGIVTGKWLPVSVYADESLFVSRGPVLSSQYISLRNKCHFQIRVLKSGCVSLSLFFFRFLFFYSLRMNN